MLILSNIFTSAWQLSAMEGRARAEMERFFSNVYSVYEALAMVGAAVNLAGNALLIPVWGAMGAAIATLASYVVIFAARAIHSRTLLKVSFSVPRFLAAMAVLVFECFLVEGERTAESVLCCAAVALLYVRPLIKATRSGFREILPRRPR